MGLQDVKNEILEEAREKAQQLEQEAQQEADEITEEAEREAEKIKKQAEKEIEQEKEAERKKAISNARMKARKKRLEAKQEKIDQAFKNFSENIQDLEEDQKRRFVENTVEDADFNVEKAKASQKFKKAVEENNLEFEEEEIDGFILLSSNGERSKNFSREKILQTFKDNYRKQVAKKLFAEVDE